MKTLTKSFGLFFLSLGLMATVKAQQGFGTNNPAASSVIDMTATNKGFLAPRVALAGGLTDATTIPNAADALTVFNTATAGTAPNNVTPGYYYWSKDTVVPANSKWVRLVDANTPMLTPWNVESTTTPANANNQNIYQNGNVGIGDFTDSLITSQLDVRGAIRGGTRHIGTVGANSIAIGTNNTSSGINSSSFGEDNIVSSDNSTAFGLQNTVSDDGYGGAFGSYNNVFSPAINSFAFGSGNSILSGYASMAVGSTNNISSDYATAMGFSNRVFAEASNAFGTYNYTGITAINSFITGRVNRVYGENSAVFGESNWSMNYAETVIGFKNAIQLAGNLSAPGATDPLFQIGNGDFSLSAGRNNAMTVLKSGNTGIGIFGSEASAKPTERLDIGYATTVPADANNLASIRIRGINEPYYSGSATDKIVVADANGVLKTRTNKLITVNTAYTVNDTDYTIIITGGAMNTSNITLPQASLNNGRIINIINYSGATQNVLGYSGVAPEIVGGSFSMSGTASISLDSTQAPTTLRGRWTLQCDGNKWYLIGAI